MISNNWNKNKKVFNSLPSNLATFGWSRVNRDCITLSSDFCDHVWPERSSNRRWRPIRRRWGESKAFSLQWRIWPSSEPWDIELWRELKFFKIIWLEMRSVVLELTNEGKMTNGQLRRKKNLSCLVIGKYTVLLISKHCVFEKLNKTDIQED